ncbi:MAG: hypothetical protein CMC08_06515 [Flavobacteriaceae bacterium]|nr:hypothetical protein [Flavobacteriaceae bacterium]
MTKQNNKLTLQKYNRQGKGSTNLAIGGIIVFLIAITPFIFYSYESFPSDTQVWETSLFTITTSYFSINSYFWFLISKIVPLYLLLLWFFTCKHWWHWIILVPIAMYSFQLWAVINQNTSPDEIELYYVIPLMMVLVPFVYLIRAKLFAKVREDDLKSFEEELMTEKTLWQQVKDLFR